MGIWHLEDAARFAAFREASDGWRFAPGAGLPGRILVSGKPEWMVDLADKERFPREPGWRSRRGFDRDSGFRSWRKRRSSEFWSSSRSRRHSPMRSF